MPGCISSICLANFFSNGVWNSQCMHLWLFPLGDIPVPLMWTCSMCLFTLLGLASITLQWGQGLLLFLEHIFFFSFMYTTLSSSQMPFTRCKSKFFCWIKFFLQFSHCTEVPLCPLFTCSLKYDEQVKVLVQNSQICKSLMCTVSMCLFRFVRSTKAFSH